MLKKLRRKIVAINMSMICLVLLGAFCVFCMNSYRSAQDDLERSLRASADFDGGSPFPMIGQKDRPKDDRPVPSVPFVSVFLDREGTLLRKSENNAGIEAETLSEAIRKAEESSGECGMISSLGLMYLKRQTPEGQRIVFADAGSVTGSLKRNILISLLLFAVGFFIFFLISLWLSGLAVRPIETAWKQQRQFIADASHELKTPLTVILANSGILRAHPDQTVSDQLQWMDGVDEEARRMKQLIDQMLTLAKSDAGRSPPDKKEFCLSSLVEETLLVFEPAAYEKGVLLDSYVEPDIRLVSDPALIRQIGLILLDNAVKYSPEKSEISVRLVRKGNTVVLSVRNFGDPIPAEALPHLFERFYRADPSRTTEGFGLGLAIAQDMALRLGASLSAASSEAEGTVFSLTLKLAK